MRILLVRLTHYFQKEQWISLTFLELESSMVYYALKLTYRGFFWLVVKLHWMGFASGYQQNQQWLATDWTEQHLQLDVWMNRCGGIFHLIQRPVFTNLFLTDVCVDLLIELVRSWEWRSSFLHMWSCCPNLPAANNTCSKQTPCGLVIAVTEAKLLPFEKTYIQQSTATRVLIPFEFCHDYFFPLKRVSLCHKTTQVCEMQICKGYTANSRISDMVSLDIRQNPKHLVEWFCISAAHTTD